MKQFIVAIFILAQCTHASVEAVMYSDIQYGHVFQPVSCVQLIKIVCGNTIGSLKGMAAFVNLISSQSQTPARPAKTPSRNSRNMVGIVQPLRQGDDSSALSVNAGTAVLLFSRAPATAAGVPGGAFIIFLAVCMFFLRLRLNAWLACAVYYGAQTFLNYFFQKTLFTVNGNRGFQISEAPSCGD